MASSDTRKILKGTHRLILTPTNLSAAFPYGGTEIGIARNMEFRWGARGHTERAEEHGGQAHRRLWTGDWAAMAGVLRSWDSEALASADPTYVAGGSGNAIAEYVADDDGSRGGRFLTGVAILAVHLKSPTSQPAALLYNGLPIQNPNEALILSARREGGLHFMSEGALDATGRVYQVGMLEDLTL